MAAQRGLPVGRVDLLSGSQLRRHYDAVKFTGKEYVIFPCRDDVPKRSIFTYDCDFL